MQSEVLNFKSGSGDYEIYILTNDNIDYSWEKFQGRVGSASTNPSTYCTYTSSENGEWQLFDYATQHAAKVENPGKAQPVVFETNKYHICIYFAKGIKDPRILHVRNDVVNWFSEDPRAKAEGSPKLEGDTDFLNEPGVFKLQFEYIKAGKTLSHYITFDVVSPKMDTKDDYKSLLAVVNREYENIIFRYLSTTYQQFTKGRVNNDEIWLSHFEQVVEHYLQGIKIILRSPHSKMTKYVESRKVERVKRWTPQLEEEYAETEKEGKLETHYFRIEQSMREIDSKENRFVKHTLFSMGNRLRKVLAKIISTLVGKGEMSEGYQARLEDYRHTIEQLQKHPFFKGIGRFQGMASDSLVLQSRQGYSQVYKSWIMLRRGIDLYSGKANIGTLQIWEIYELWCFIKMKHIIQEVMGINEAEYESLVTEPKGSMLNAFTNTKLEYVVEYRFPKGHKRENDIVSLHYQHTFNRRNQDDDNIHTATTEQRPDIVLNIKKQGSRKIVLTYLYDVKYRVWNDKKLDIDFEQADIEEQQRLNIKGADYPPSDAINQMHRYRDAIYYGTDLHKQTSKEIIGGYVLFPGRGDEGTVAQRYYQKSMATVNIGAIPLLPQKNAETEGALLKKHLETILTLSNAGKHVEHAIPQRGLEYVEETDKSPVLLVGYAKHSYLPHIRENKMYYIPVVDNRTARSINPNYDKVRYVLLHTDEPEERILYKVNGKPAIITGQEIKDLGFPTGAKPTDVYFKYTLFVGKEATYEGFDKNAVEFGEKDITKEFYKPKYRTMANPNA